MPATDIPKPPDAPQPIRPIPMPPQMETLTQQVEAMHTVIELKEQTIKNLHTVIDLQNRIIQLLEHRIDD